MIVLKILVILNFFILGLYMCRHAIFALNRLFTRQKRIYLGIEDAPLPSVAILVPAHNEESVIADSLQALMRIDYPQELYQVYAVNDRSKDRTKEIIDAIVARYPGRIIPVHRTGGKPGKAAALNEVCQTLTCDVIVIFDADYLPTPSLLKNLVSPFLDPAVGGVMGRVVPLNVNSNILTRMLDLERSGGYQVDQQARMNMDLIPQFGGTVGGCRKKALDDIGGWNDEVLSEDTDLTLRLFLNNWKVVYQNTAECYEEVPETWPVRIRQVKRWAKGHNHVFINETWNLLKSDLDFWKKFDGLLLLGIYFLSPLCLVTWVLALILFFKDQSTIALISIHLMPLLMFSSLGNFGLYLETAAAVWLDGFRGRIRLLPLGLVFFFTGLIVISDALLRQMFWELPLKKKMVWDKTARFRKGPST